MGYKVPSLDEFHGFAVGFWKSFFPLSNVGSRFSYHWKRLRAYAGGVTDLHAHIASAQLDVMPDTARGAFLTRWGNIVKVTKKSATPARGTNALRVFGVVASAVAVGDELTHSPTGFTFQITEIGTIPSGGYVDVDIAAISTGAATRLSAGETLAFVSAPAGIQTNAKLVLDLDQDGFDDEQDPAYSTRVTDELGKPRMGGHQSDFEKWALEVVGNATAYAYPNRAGIGTVDVVAMHAGLGTARELTSPERDATLAYIRSKAPAQVGAAQGPLRVLETIADPQAIEITVTPNGDLAHEFDWIDTSPPVVLVYTASPPTVQFAAAVPASMLAGMRIAFRGVASAQDGRQFTIETVSAADTIILRETPAVALVATDVGYSGGPLVDPIRDAIIAHINGEIIYADDGVPLPASVSGSKVNLRILAEGMGPANPAGVYGTWSGSLVRATLGRIASYPTGARNVAIVSPAADYDAVDPVFPNDATINFITPSAVLVRKG